MKTSRLKEHLWETGLKKKQCEHCGTGDTWNGKPLMLQLDHKDGNRFNNELENLEIVCPNCHSQTPTYAGRNTRKHPLGVPRHRELSEAEKIQRKVKTDWLESKKKEILESDIDFSKFGWVEKVSDIIGITPQRTRNWMKKNLPEILIRCYKRKSIAEKPTGRGATF